MVRVRVWVRVRVRFRVRAPHGCGRGGRVVLPLARAAAVWTGLREQVVLGERLEFDSDGQPPLVRVRVSYSA